MKIRKKTVKKRITIQRCRKGAFLYIMIAQLCVLSACAATKQEAVQQEQEAGQSEKEKAGIGQEKEQSGQDTGDSKQDIVQSGQDIAQSEQGAGEAKPDEALSETLDGQITDQSFPIGLEDFGEVVFAPFEPVSYASENPDYGTTMFGDVRFMLLSAADGEKIYDFPGETEDNILSGFIQFKQVISVNFQDYNEDGRMDIILILEYLNADGEPFRRARVYAQKDREKGFSINEGMSEFLWDYTESMDKINEGIALYKENNVVFNPDDLSEEELMELLNERMEYYTKSAYYSEMTDYWENVREVRDISYHMVPLYESNNRYLTKDELALEPQVVIHLAKNEIYARHGYIFKDQDLYNYFMGCIWYTPTIAPEDFSDGVFNEYEKENLKLLGELDLQN